MTVKILMNMKAMRKQMGNTQASTAKSLTLWECLLLCVHLSYSNNKHLIYLVMECLTLLKPHLHKAGGFNTL